MKERILISIIIPSYNRADTVGFTIDSIINQQVDADIEIVIGDDCSTDNAREVLSQYKEKYPEIIRLFFWEKNLGLGANWASCVKECRGKYICNCDNDDYWHNPNKLQIQLDYMESHPECNICITNHRTHNRDTDEIKECLCGLNFNNDIQTEMYHGGNFCNATIMYRADYMKKTLDLDEFIKRRLALQDWPAWVILTANTGVDLIPVSTATFGIETVSITRPATYEMLERRYERDRKVCAYLGELFPHKFPYSDEMWASYQDTQLMNMAFRKGDFSAAKRYGAKANKSLKQKCSQNRMLFGLYCFVKKIMKSIK